MSYKRAMIGKIEIGRNQLGMSRDDMQARLEEVTGKTSRAACSESELAKFIDYLAQCGAVFTSSKSKRPADKTFKAKAAQRRSDFYEIPDGPHARQKRYICAMWKDLGYDMTSLDTRTERQLGIKFFRWCNDPAFLQTLGKDLEKRLARKKKRESEAQA